MTDPAFIDYCKRKKAMEEEVRAYFKGTGFTWISDGHYAPAVAEFVLTKLAKQGDDGK
jgi:hypothetical protein